MGHVCPWWLSYVLANRFRGWLHDPQEILGPYARRGMTVVDLGCGMGFFSIALAHMVGDQGRVIAVDLQQQVLDVLEKRARKAGVGARIRTHRCKPDRIGIRGPADFALAFWMVHEVPDPGGFLGQVRSLLKPGGKLLVVEPKIHVSRRKFQETLDAARRAGLALEEEPRVRISRAAVLAVTPFTIPASEKLG